MDKKTLDAYNAKAADYAEDWLNQPNADELHSLAKKFFIPGQSTADIGCGSGRDTAWLNANDYPCVGFDASEGLLTEARTRFPTLSFKSALLPYLREVRDGIFTNVLCETVIMHLARADHAPALENLLRITRPGGVLSLSWRLPKDPAQIREQDGRLYESVDKRALMQLAAFRGAKVLHDAAVVSASSGKKIEQLVLVKPKT